MPVINTTSRNLELYREKKIRDIKNLVIDTITKVEVLAIKDAPLFVNIDKKFSDGGLKGQVGIMGKDKETILAEGGEATNEENMAAYFEFGTGLSAVTILANYPQWIRDIAKEYYVDGSGRLKGKPYLFNNFLNNIPIFERELKKILNGRFNDN